MNILQRLAGAALGLLLFAAALVFASVVLAIVAALALLVWAWVWWRRRNLPQRGAGVVIEGEYRVEGERTRLEDRER
ncbi:MAG: hypothetical protein HY017_24195 [Betaproteobacteria bacterium]|nr:hypothetical protein [Betaproteobacteria bacterium]